MKKLAIITLLSITALASLGGFAHSSNVAKAGSLASQQYTTNASTYYSGITATKGTDLLGQLHDLMATTHQTYTSYDDCKTPSTIYKLEPGSSSSYITDFYTQNDIGYSWGGGNTGTWNREHVWCQSHSLDRSKTSKYQLWGETYGGSDLHHIRPIESTLNSTRNNNEYGLVANHDSSTTRYAKDTSKNYITSHPGGYLEDGIFEPIDTVKGDVARILFYVYMHYSDYTYVGGSTNGSYGLASNCGKLQMTDIVNAKDYNSDGITNNEDDAFALLLAWNASDPVSSVEQVRNEQASKYQGNRNPFIDHPEYASAIWGDGTLQEDTITLSLNKTSLSFDEEGETYTLIPTLSNGESATISYSSNKTSVATVSNSGVVTAVGNGTATITVTATYGGKNYTATCFVTVNIPEVVTLSLDKASITLTKKGETSTITPSLSDGGSATYNYVSSDTSVATVSSSGVVTAVKKGTATITVSTTYQSQYLEATCSVTVDVIEELESSILFTNKETGDSGSAYTAPASTWVYDSDFSISNFYKCYPGKSSTIKLGTGTYNGSFDISFTSSGKVIKKVYVTASRYGSDSGYLTVTGDGKTIQASSIPNGSEVEFDLSSKQATSVTIATTEKRCYISKIRIIYASTGKVFDSFVYTDSIPDKTRYFTNETFDPTGLVIKAHYTDSVTYPDEDITSSIVWDALVSGSSATGTYNNETVTINGLSILQWLSASPFKQVTSLDQIVDGAKITLVGKNNDDYYFIGKYTSGNNIKATKGMLDAGGYLRCTGENFETYTLKDSSTNGQFNFVTSDNKYLTASGEGANRLTTGDEVVNNASWNIAFNDDGTISLSAPTNTTNGYVRFSTYQDNFLFSGYGTSSFSKTNEIYMYVDMFDNLNQFGNQYLHMSDYNENLGYCHDYFDDAKTFLLNNLGSDYIYLLQNYYEVEDVANRYEAWATFNDAYPYKSGNLNSTKMNNYDDEENYVLVIISLMMTSSLGLFIFLKKKKEK